MREQQNKKVMKKRERASPEKRVGERKILLERKKLQTTGGRRSRA